MEDDVRGRDLVCSFTVRNLYLAVLGKVQVDEQLFAPISPDDSSWEIGACFCISGVITVQCFRSAASHASVVNVDCWQLDKLVTLIWHALNRLYR